MRLTCVFAVALSITSSRAMSPFEAPAAQTQHVHLPLAQRLGQRLTTARSRAGRIGWWCGEHRKERVGLA
jgi:hypothetical protein